MTDSDLAAYTKLVYALTLRVFQFDTSDELP